MRVKSILIGLFLTSTIFFLNGCSPDTAVSPSTNGKTADLGSIPYTWEVDQSTIPGCASSDGPVGCTFNGRQYMFYRGNNTTNLFYLYSTDEGTTWSAQFQVPAGAQSKYRPAVASFNGRLWVFYRGVSSNKILYMSMDINGNWSPQQQFDDCETTDAPSATADNNYCYIAFKGGSSNVIHIKRFTATTTLPLQSLYNPATIRTSTTPAIGLMPDGLPAIVYTRNDGGSIVHILKCSGQNDNIMTWLDPRVIGDGSWETKENWSVGVTNNSEMLVVFFKGNSDNRIYYAGCDANMIWTQEYTLNSPRTNDVPGACTFGKKVFVFFKAQTNGNLLFSRGAPIH